MQTDRHDILNREISYYGEGISVRHLEEMIHAERRRQDTQVHELEDLRSRNTELQENLVAELSRLRELSENLRKREGRSGVQNAIADFFARLRGAPITRRSIEDLLRQQYELSARRVKEAAELADKLQMAEAQLRDEIERLSRKIIESARNEEIAADYILELQAEVSVIEREKLEALGESVRARELQSELDRAKRKLTEHSALLQLYHTAEGRLAGLQENTRQLAETIGQLRSDLTLYVTAASEKLDLIAGQIQAIGAAADASIVMLEMKRSLDALTESINHATRFVSETQAYFRANVTHLVDDLELYDSETQHVLSANLGMGDAMGEMDLAEAIALAVSKSSQEVRAIDPLAAQIERAAERAQVDAPVAAEVSVAEPAFAEVEE